MFSPEAAEHSIQDWKNRQVSECVCQYSYWRLNSEKNHTWEHATSDELVSRKE